MRSRTRRVLRQSPAPLTKTSELAGARLSSRPNIYVVSVHQHDKIVVCLRRLVGVRFNVSLPRHAFSFGCAFSTKWPAEPGDGMQVVMAKNRTSVQGAQRGP